MILTLYYLQKHLATMKQRTYRQAAALARIREMSANTDTVALPPRTLSQNMADAYEEEKITDPQKLKTGIVNKFLNSQG